MRNLLFIKTSIDYGKLSYSIAPPLGLMYLAAFIKKKIPSQYNMKLVDMYLYKMSISDIEKVILNFRPDIIACSVLTLENECMHKIAKLAKGIDKRIKIIVGGPHSSIYYREIMKDENIDVAVVGEGEEAFCELLRCLEEGKDIMNIAGIAFRHNEKLIFTGFRKYIENLDRIPFPAWDLIDIDLYSKINVMSMNVILAGQKYMGIFTSRGCPYHCIYCHNIFGKYYRMRSPENVLAEIRTLYDKYNIDEFHIFDDIFNLDIDRAKKICELIISSKIKIKMAFPNGLRGDVMDEDLILKLKQAGTYQVTYALETASARLQESIKKNIDIRKVSNTIKFSDKHGLLTKCYFMLGFPTETIKEVKQTIDFACNSPLAFASFFIVNPHENTELYKIATRFSPFFKVKFSDSYYYISNREYEKIVGLPLRKIQRMAYLKFYLNPFRIIKICFKVPQKIYLLRILASFFQFYYTNIFTHNGIKIKISKQIVNKNNQKITLGNPC